MVGEAMLPACMRCFRQELLEPRLQLPCPLGFEARFSRPQFYLESDRK